MTHPHPTSWPGLTRPSTPCLRQVLEKDGDARDKPGHDGVRKLSCALAASVGALLATAVPARADLKLCNHMSYVIEAAIGIDDIALASVASGKDPKAMGIFREIAK